MARFNLKRGRAGDSPSPEATKGGTMILKKSSDTVKDAPAGEWGIVIRGTATGVISTTEIMNATDELGWTINKTDVPGQLFLHMGLDDLSELGRIVEEIEEYFPTVRVDKIEMMHADEPAAV